MSNQQNNNRVNGDRLIQCIDHVTGISFGQLNMWLYIICIEKQRLTICTNEVYLQMLQSMRKVSAEGGNS